MSSAVSALAPGSINGPVPNAHGAMAPGRSTMMTLMDEQLFEWDVKPPRQKFKPTVELVPRPPGYHLISNRSGVQGFHRTKVTADMAAYSTVLTFCGIYGRRVKDVFPDRIPLCEGCERALREEA